MASDSPGILHLAAAGAVAGIVTDAVLHPVDTIRARLQVGVNVGSARRGVWGPVWSVLTKTLQAEGVRGLYGGYSTALLWAGPTNAVYFLSYENSKDAFVESGLFGEKGQENSAVHLMSGFAAEIGASSLWTPFDVIKQRLQVQQHHHAPTPSLSHAATQQPYPQYRGMWDVMRSVWKADGIKGFYRGWLVGVCTYGPYSAAYFMTYEQMKVWLAVQPSDPGASWQHLLCGVTAGATSGALTQPIDAVKTRLQVLTAATGESLKGSQQMQALEMTKFVFKTEGLHGFYRGVVARVLWLSPAAGLMITVFERCRSM